MIVVSYDISNDKLRTRFSKFLEKYGVRIQYSVFKIKNSNRFINVIVSNIVDEFEKEFSQSDSVYIFFVDEKRNISFGSAKNLDKDFLYFE